MDPIKSEDLKVAESKNPIEALLQQTGWSLEEAVLRLSDYKSNTLESNGKISDTKSDLKAEVKEEISDYRRQFMSVNKREEESDSDVEIIEEASDKMFNTNVQDSATSIKIIDNAPDLSNKSTVIDTNSFSDKSENTCVLLTDETVNFNKTNTKVREKLKIKNLPMKYKKIYILKKYRFLKKMRCKREIEKAEKQSAVVRERLKLQLGLLREKKKPELKFLCSQPDYSQTDAQNVSENPALVHNESVVGGKKWQEESNDWCSNVMIVDVVGGYESPVREETNDDIVDLSNLKDENGMEMEYHLNSMESVVSLLYDQYGNSFQSKVPYQSYHTVPQICDMMTDCLDIELKEVLSPNENLLSEDDVCNSNNLIEQSLELTTEEVLNPNENSLASNEISEDDQSNLKICENIESPECITEEVLNPNENRSASKEISEDDQSNSSNHSKTTAKICENIEQSPEFTTDAVLKPNEYPSASNTNILSEDESNSSSHSKTTAKLKIWENIKQKLEFTNNANTEANLELLQCDKTKSTGTFLRSLSANIFTKPVPNTITPTKTKDITKIKGWKNKRFVECEEGKSTMTKESSIIQTQKENILSDASPFVSTKQLDQAPTVFTASNINEPSTSAAGLASPSISTISTEVIAPTVFTASNINEPSTSAAGLATPSISTISTEVIAPTVFTPSNINEPSTSAAGLASPSISTISTEVIASSEHNIALSPGEDLDLHTAVISTTSIMSTSNTPTIAHSETSSVSTISTVAPVLSVSPTVLTNSNVPSTSSTSDAYIKPYKPKTLAEKRRLLEESKLPLTAELIFSMNREQRKSNRSRILKYRNQLVRNKVPFDRESYKISSDITKTYSYVVCNSKRLKVTSHKNDQVLTYIKNRKKASKTQYIPARSKTPRVSNIKKPSLLESLKEPIKEEKYDATQWETVEVKLPKVSISVVPQYGQVLHPGLEHLIGNETWFLSENRVRFALSLLRTTAKPKLKSFKFPVCYANQETTMKMKKKMPVVVKPDEFVRTESDDAIQVGVNSVIEKLLNYVDNLDEINKLNIQVENVENTTEKPSLPVPEVVQTIKRYTGPRSKINKTALEMKRLNCKIVSVANDEDGTDNENCTKEVCKLGCICKTLACDSKNLLPVHCGSWECIFNCNCKNNNNMDSTSLPSGNNLLNAGVINRLQDQAKKNLAKVEKEFTQTIIKTSNQLIMVGDSKERRRRVTKTPKKYSDYLNEDLTDGVDIHQLSIDDEVLSALPNDIKPCSVPLTKYNLNDIIPFCMIHSMYRCVCIDSSDPAALLSIPPVTSRYTKVLSPQKAESLKVDAGKIQRPYKYKAAPRPDGFVKPAVIRPKYAKRQRDDKTFNKEEFCSRTRGISTSYYITRNTMESQLEKMLRSSKKFSRDLQRYVRSLRVKFSELRRTSGYGVPRDIRKEEIERELVRQTIERLSPFLRSELHLDSIMLRLDQRMNGIVTPETMRRKRPIEIQSNNTEISQDPPEEMLPSNNLNDIVECDKTNNTKDNDSDQQPAMLGPINFQEKHMYSSKQKEFRLLPWLSLQNNYNKKALEIWYLNTTKISPIIITQRNERPSVNHCNIRVFEQLPEDDSIPLDFIRCIIRKKVPMNKNPENIFVILAFNENDCSELYSVCEKTLGKDNVTKNIRVALLQQIKETPPTKDVDVESVITKEMNENITIDDQTEVPKEDEILEGEFQHCDLQNLSKKMNYSVRKFKPHTLFYENVGPSLFEIKRDVRLPLPREAIKCKWRLIYTDQIFSYLRSSLNDFSIKYSDIMKFVHLARKKRKTVIITSDKLRKHYSHKNFGIYCVPNHLDKVFLGPYLNDEDHNVVILISQLFQFRAIKESMTIDCSNGLWVNQIDNYQDCEDSTCNIISPPDNCIDLTADEDELKSILKNLKCNNFLRILGCSSECIQNDDDEDTTNYDEDTYWNDLNLLMKGIDFEKSQEKIGNEIMEKIYYSMKNKTTVRYFVTNIPGLGYIKAFLHDITNVVDILCPLTNKIRRFSNYDLAVRGITRIFVQYLIMLPLKSGFKVKMMAKLNPTMKTPLSSTVLDGYHVAGSFGVRNIRGSSKEQLRIILSSDSEVEFVVLQRNKRRIFDLTNLLAQSFSLQGTSVQRSHGDVLTEVIKKIISTGKLGPAGSSIQNIEKALRIINIYPRSIKSKIYKQLEFISCDLIKKELSPAEPQKITMSAQKRKSVSQNSPSKSTNSVVDEATPGFHKIRLFPPTENSINLETTASKELTMSQFQRIRLSNRINLINNKPEIELKPITGEGIKVKEIRRSLPNEKFIVSKYQKKPNLSGNDVIITKLNRLHSFGTTVVANNDKKKHTLDDDDDVIIIEPEPSTIQKTKPTSLLRNQKQPELKKRSLQLEDKVIIQPEPKRLKSNIQKNDVVQPELKNYITQLQNGAVLSQSKKSEVQNNIVVARPKTPTQKPLQVLLANGNTTSLLKGKYINLLPLKGKGKNKYVILGKKDNGVQLRQNIDMTKIKRISTMQNCKKVLATPQNGKSLLVPQSTNGTTITLTTLTTEQSLIKVPVQNINKVSVPKLIPLSNNMPANQKSTSSLDKSSSSFITIQKGDTTQCFKVLKKKVDSVKEINKNSGPTRY